ncbi:Uncharacterised protein [Citrobacter koseri]|uniref:Uncharacterized protein n=1 Tax=Citrobacter koseri TaxID=545 RepID=A0A2X2VZP8_CITKO|nr:Uncharacterised protein [Citrobacter koseri]
MVGKSPPVLAMSEIYQKKDIGVAAPDFKPTYVATERGKEVLAKLKQDVQHSDAVFPRN